jgi:hypothetical protein
MASGAGLLQAQISVWTGDVVRDEHRVAESGELRPMTLVGARNGTFSGKVILESRAVIKEARAAVSQLDGPAGSIPADNIQIRYAVTWERTNWGWPSGPDILLEEPPAEVPPRHRGRGLLPIWVTISVPRDASPGMYSGELTVQAEGLEPTKVPVQLEVLDYVLPDPQDYRTWVDFVQSPDTLALEYNVPLWSDRHWELIARSFDLLSPTGNRMLYVPLICRTNFGNEQSMIRWIKKGENQYEQDFSILDKYLDIAEKHLGKPKLVAFIIWDVCMSENSLGRSLWGGEQGAPTRESREQLLGKGPRVTSIDPQSGETDMIFLPRYETEEGKKAWAPVWAALRERMEKRGLKDAMMLGTISDLQPSRAETTAIEEITGGLPWIAQAHPNYIRGADSLDNKRLHGIANIHYMGHVYNQIYQVNPDLGRLYGWRGDLLPIHYLRGGDLNMGTSIDIRLLPKFNITGGQRGAGRMGGDMWSVLRNARGDRTGLVYARYPENNWRNLDIGCWFLAPGPQGALATARLENLREGVQECEARIFLERVLLDDTKRQKIGQELADEIQKMLDDQHRAMWKTVWNNDDELALIGMNADGRNPPEGFWQALGKTGKKLPGYWAGEGHALRGKESGAGQQWWFESGWQNRSRELLKTAGKVQQMLN